MKRCTPVLGAMLAIASVTSAHAQSIDAYSEADTGSANVSLRVFVPLLGWQTVAIAQQPIDEAQNPAGGGTNDQPQAAASIVLGTGALASFDQLDNDAVDSAPGSTANGSAYSHVGTVSLLGGLIQATNLAAQVSGAGNDSSGTPSVSLSASTSVGNLTVNGVSVLQGNIPANTTIPISLSLPVSVAGLINAIIPVSGQLTLNEQIPLGPYGIDLNAMHLRAQGGLAGLAQINIDLIAGGPVEEFSPNDAADSADCAVLAGGSGYLTDPNNAQKFFMCFDGMAYSHSCAAGLIWNAAQERCDWPDAVAPANLRRVATR